MKKRFSFIIAALLCLLAAMTMTVCVSADELPDSSDKIGKMTVVYLRDNGTGDGSDYANAVGTLEDAYMMLDLSQDCTIVVCDVFTQINPDFSIGEQYEGKVTITSCYGGYDYRKIGARFEYDPFRFYCWGETAFEYIEFYTPKTNMLVIGQYNPVTIGEEVKISGDKMTGTKFSLSFGIVGGYQKPRSTSTEVVPMEDNRDTSITVMSGEFIYVVPFSRELGGNSYEGTARVKIGGNAKISVLHGTAIGTNTYVGDVEIEITDNAHIKSFYGATEAGINAKSHTITWKSGTIDRFEWLCSFSKVVDLTHSGKTVLNASDTVKAYAGYAKIATLFDSVSTVDQDGAYVPAENPNTQKPGDDIIKAPTTTKTPPAPDKTQPDNDQGNNDPSTGNQGGNTNNGGASSKEEQPVFTRAPRESTSTPGDSTADSGEDKGGSNTTLIIYIAAAVGVAVIAAVVVVILTKKKKA